MKVRIEFPNVWGQYKYKVLLYRVIYLEPGLIQHTNNSVCTRPSPFSWEGLGYKAKSDLHIHAYRAKSDLHIIYMYMRNHNIHMYVLYMYAEKHEVSILGTGCTNYSPPTPIKTTDVDSKNIVLHALI